MRLRFCGAFPPKLRLQIGTLNSSSLHHPLVSHLKPVRVAFVLSHTFLFSPALSASRSAPETIQLHAFCTSETLRELVLRRKERWRQGDPLYLNDSQRDEPSRTSEDHRGQKQDVLCLMIVNYMKGLTGNTTLRRFCILVLFEPDPGKCLYFHDCSFSLCFRVNLVLKVQGPEGSPRQAWSVGFLPSACCAEFDGESLKQRTIILRTCTVIMASLLNCTVNAFLIWAPFMLFLNGHFLFYFSPRNNAHASPNY